MEAYTGIAARPAGGLVDNRPGLRALLEEVAELCCSPLGRLRR